MSRRRRRGASLGWSPDTGARPVTFMSDAERHAMVALEEADRAMRARIDVARLRAEDLDVTHLGRFITWAEPARNRLEQEGAAGFLIGGRLVAYAPGAAAPLERARTSRNLGIVAGGALRWWEVPLLTEIQVAP